jgi:phenylalanyl-tRNA synthetase beta chain
MSTDASYRFERGVDPQAMETAVRRALDIILSTAGGELDPVVLDVCPRPWKGLTLPLRPDRVERVLGVRLTPPELGALLTPLGFEVLESSEAVLQIGVPGFRSYDVQREVDLIEEVARTYGYDRFPEELGPFRPGIVPDHPLFLLEDELRDLLVGEGFFEAQTQAFAPEGEGEVELSNPISAQESFLRGSLVPGLLRRMEYNLARGVRNVRLFETGTVFAKGEPAKPPREEARLGVVLVGQQAPSHWGGESRSVDLWGVKGLLERLASAVAPEGAELAEKAPAEKGCFGHRAGFIETESFTLLSKTGEPLGVGGRIDSGGLDLPAWAGPVFGIEMGLPSEPKVRPSPVFQPLPAFPAVERDIAALLPDDLPARRVEEEIRMTAGALLSKLEVFDLYEGQGIPAGHRSVAFRLQFRSSERTLTDSEVEEALSAVIGRLREELGVETRG